MERTLISQISDSVGRRVRICGRVLNVRRLGQISFVVVQDYTSVIQAVAEKDTAVKVGEAVTIEGLVREEKRAQSGVELTEATVEVISPLQAELPFDLSRPELKLNLTTLLDQRALSLRHPKVQAIFKLYDILLKGYETVMRAEGFTEVKTPKLLGAATEGGANFFQVKYFDRQATLAQSPQFYKQIMVGVLERVFEIGSAFRAEPHFTTRHVNEYTSLDAELGFIDGFYDVINALNRVVKLVFALLQEEGEPFLKLYGVEAPTVPDEIPQVKLAELKKIIHTKYDYTVPATTDLDPEGERLAGRYAQEEFASDFLFVTHYPWAKKPFYTMPSQEDPAETDGFDLLYKGLEIVTGGQRIHSYDQLIANMKKKRVKPDGMEFYLETFKYGLPPHGGWGWGSERTIQQLLGLASVKEALLFPRDVKRLSP